MHLYEKELLRDLCCPKSVGAALLLFCMLAAPAAKADVKIGVTLPLTGFSAVLGHKVHDAMTAWPKVIAGQSLIITVMDDGGDPGAATKNAQRLAAEYNVDVLVSTPFGPESLAVGAVARQNEILHLTQPAAAIRNDQQSAVEQSTSLPGLIFKHMKTNKVVTIGFIGFSDAWGDLWLKQLKEFAAPLGLKLAVEERFARTDSSVDVQADKLVNMGPDAILIAASGAAAMLPQLALRKSGYSRLIYHTSDSATNDFIHIAGPGGTNTILPATPSIIMDVSAKQGFNAQLSGQGSDVSESLAQLIPQAIRAGKPGTKEFRVALRQVAQTAMGGTKLTAANPDDRIWVLVTVKDGAWILAR
jgi:branched-chain amino acid transport system substrate-binding protein